MSLHRPAVVAAFLLLVALPTVAQQLPIAGETIDVSIINVDVYVTDRNGNRVRSLTRDDFEIREDGKLQPITNFAEYAPDAKTAEGTFGVEAAATVSVAPPAKRTVIIFVEVVPRPSARVREIFDGLREFVRKSVRPGDAATVVAFRTRSETRQEFTDDTEALEHALAQLERESIGVAADAHDQIRRAVESDANAARLLSGVRGHAVGGAASVTDLGKSAADMFAMVDLRRKGAALTSLMESISGVEGKKIMVLALHRFGLLAGDASGEIFFKADTRVEKVRQAVMRTANANGITLYPLYAPGVEWPSFGPDPQELRIDVSNVDGDADLSHARAGNANALNQTMSLVQIAQETGGLMASGPADIAKLLPRVSDDLETYYSLAYRVTDSGTDSRRKVVVTTKNRAYEVRSRRAVVDKSDDTQMDDRVVANLFQPLAHSLIPIEISLGTATQLRRNRWSVPVKVRIPISALTPLERDGAAAGSFSVFVGTGRDYGLISDVEHQKQEYTIKLDDLAIARRSHFTYNVTVEFDELADAISIGVRDDVSKEYGLVRAALPAPARTNEQVGGSVE
ncbi:MAG TPA: VWA domain-containing protein [Thermoanaerobaculia bacterium]|nr:VWA domain-containing protein [Thermoanaerobaculia bacterium]